MYRNANYDQKGNGGSITSRGGFPNFMSVIRSRRRPDAWANVNGSESYPEIRGNVRFYQTPYGTLVATEFSGLPLPRGGCDSPIFGFHIHEGGSCGGMGELFGNTGDHYNPYFCPHPYHAGDLSPLFGAGGYAFSAFLTDRFAVDEIIGKTVVLHIAPDDFMSQPSGNSRSKIACGEIMR